MGPLNQYYLDFSQYYQKKFRQDLNQLFKSYCLISNNDTVFLGFNKDNLIHIDTIIMGMHIKDLKFPNEKDIAKFTMAIWTIIVSDLIVYCLYHDYSELWENLTHYPKFTGWNYYATEPNHFLQIMEHVYPTQNIHEEISIMISKFRNKLVS